CQAGNTVKSTVPMAVLDLTPAEARDAVGLEDDDFPCDPTLIDVRTARFLAYSMKALGSNECH
ncbi:hypothetical protein PP533_25920, partial [Mycobacteroides abscessus]|nr:hypothetical protein [Mycobacteroides abscessus]MDM2361496.1 hypothetical protein [Mycobacteroides abscessus]